LGTSKEAGWHYKLPHIVSRNLKQDLLHIELITHINFILSVFKVISWTSYNCDTRHIQPSCSNQWSPVFSLRSLELKCLQIFTEVKQSCLMCLFQVAIESN